MKKSPNKLVIIFCLLLSVPVIAQVESPLQVFNRGQLWQSVLFGKNGPTYNDWRKAGPSLDWPGFETNWLRTDIGGSPSYMVTGGLWVGAKKKPDSVLAVEDWAMYGSTVGSDVNAKYIVTKNIFKYKNGSNYWLQTDSKSGEEVIETEYEYNPNYVLPNSVETQLPVKVNRTIHQWSGSQKDENYIIYQYVIKNISNELKIRYPLKDIPDTLYGFRIMLTYAMQANSRSWNVIFPQETPGARNTQFFHDPSRKMMYGYAGDYPLTPISQGREDFGLSLSQGIIKNGSPSGEYLAPAYVGVKLLYSSSDSSGTETRIGKYGWSAGVNAQDLQGPFYGVPGFLQDKYNLLTNPATAYQFYTNPVDLNYSRKNRTWSLMNLGPWNILPGDSIVIAFCEVVNGVDYKTALNVNLGLNVISSGSQKQFNASVARAQFTYDQSKLGKGFNHPDPPPAPEFKVEYFKGADIVANVISFGKETEALIDNDYGFNKIVGYKLYRSGFLPLGPWDSIATVFKGDVNYYQTDINKYVFVDSTVEIGKFYYYAITAFDTGQVRWPVNELAIFPETGTNKVPPMESSIYASSNNAVRKGVTPFLSTLPPKSNLDEVLVVPNPFVIREGFSSPIETDQIQFVNIPNPCTIRIYTVRGDLVKTISVEFEGGIVSWDQVTDYGQFAESGIYIYYIDSLAGTKIGKFAIVR
jgi:hypothetical protein